MYWTMLRRELQGRKRQTATVAVGLAIAIALVIVVSSLSAGVQRAQADALAGISGVGTDLTVTGAASEPGSGGGGPRFEFDAGEGESTGGGPTQLNQSRLMTSPMRSTLPEDTVATVAEIEGVAAATGVLSLTNTSFSGELPSAGSAPEPQGGGREQGGQQPGGGAFGIESVTVLGVPTGGSDLGPLSATTLTDGAGFSTDEAAPLEAILDSAYATTAELAVGDTVSIGNGELSVVGIVTSDLESASSAANVYLPIETARTLSESGAVVSTIYVSADTATAAEQVQTAIEAALPDATVSSQADLAAQVSGSLASAAGLITNLGTWLSIIVLAVALAIAALLTSAGVARRTREFGTLKAIGWPNRRVVQQIAGESLAQALIGGVAGLALGLGAIWILNLVGITLPGAAAPGASAPRARGGGPGREASAATADIVLHAPITPWIVAAAVVLAVLGGVLAGAFGAWRAARLSPTEALRAIA